MEKIEEVVELELWNAFGQSYVVYGLPREHIEAIIRDIDIREVVQKAYGAYCSQYADGVAQLDISTGKVVAATYTTGTGDIEGAHYIDIFSVPRNLDLLVGDILDEEESQRYYLEEPGTVEDFCSKEGIDYAERELEALIHYAWEYMHSDEYTARIEEQLNSIYAVEGEKNDI